MTGELCIEINVITVGIFVIVLLVWANDGARTKPRCFKPFIHFVYKGKVTAVEIVSIMLHSCV